MLNLVIILGTRPEIIKTWPIIVQADVDPQIRCIVVHTGQHYDYEMAQIFFEELELREPDIFLNAQGTTHGTQTAEMLIKIEEFLLKENPDVVGILGDTNSALAGALAAQKLDIPTAHFEAGCRSFDRRMPEELNRLLIDSISPILFAPSRQAEINLLWEGHAQSRVFSCGNTQKDVLNHAIKIEKPVEIIQDLVPPYGVITVHRTENTDNLDRLKEILMGIVESPIPLVFPVHPRTKKQLKKLKLNSEIDVSVKIHMIPPIGYLSFITLLSNSYLVLTDSGGIQEEAALLNVPCITLRDTTEWPETILSGKNILVGNDKGKIKATLNKLCKNKSFHQEMSTSVKLYKSGAGERIVAILKSLWRKEKLNIDPVNMLKCGYPVPHLRNLDSSLDSENVLYNTLTFNQDGIIETNNSNIDFKLQFIKQLNQ
jgi:UDP-N-acetylglucosamine 2-epimerase (non-hydrolysing)